MCYLNPYKHIYTAKIEIELILVASCRMGLRYGRVTLRQFFLTSQTNIGQLKPVVKERKKEKKHQTNQR